MRPSEAIDVSANFANGNFFMAATSARDTTRRMTRETAAGSNVLDCLVSG
jgi:hypothetical protein